MTRRCLHIGIRTRAEGKRVLRAAFARVRRGDLTPQEPGLYFETVEDLRRILTDKRLDLLLEVARSRPESVRALADQLGRDYLGLGSGLAIQYSVWGNIIARKLHASESHPPPVRPALHVGL